MADPYVGADGLRAFRRELAAWLDEHDASFARRAPGASLADEVARTRANQRQLWDADWLRYGWPTSEELEAGLAAISAALRGA